MKIIIFGLTITSSWGNGHATIWRGLCRALAEQGHRLIFFERDVPYYAAHRDLMDMEGMQIVLYQNWYDVLSTARANAADADAAIVTSYCPDALAATEMILSSSAGLKIFYDLDAPVTLDHLAKGESVSYISERGLKDFDLVLSFTGGRTLAELKERLGARKVAPLYGSVDPATHYPVTPVPTYKSDLSYLGTYAADRQEALETLFVEPSRRLLDKRFLIGGSLYPQSFPWATNIFYLQHVPPPEHSAFYCSSLFTLNVTRGAMALMGYCPSGRLFEAAACGVPIISDYWEGIETFFSPGAEIILARSSEDTIAALQMSRERMMAIAKAARERVLDEHASSRRADEFTGILQNAFSGSV